MPELPEVETMRRGVLGVVGSTIERVEFCRGKCKPIQVSPSPAAVRKKLTGRPIVDIARRGKRLIVVVAGAGHLVIEPRMTGLVLVAEPPNQEHLRLRMELSGVGEPELLFWDRRGLGTVRLVADGDLETFLGPDRLGPDALEISAEQLSAQLKRSRRAIKVALLDQRAVAGIGNLYASEILHLATIHPERRCDRLTGPQWDRLHAAIGAVLRQAIQYEGSTLSDGTYRNALNQDGGYQNQHRVYDRAGQTCRTCGGAEVTRIVQAQRSTFYCGNCQRKGRK